MKREIVTFFGLQRQIFGVCPECEQFFRLSETRVYLRKKPQPDWMDKLNGESRKLDAAEERIDEQESQLRDKAREKGRRTAQARVKKIDRVFTPLHLNPDDAKVIFHPIDYVVFDGMKEADKMRGIVLLDREEKDREHRALQRSIERTVETGNYDWETLRVREDGKIEME
jgi:predicted Holliday junction resolvase-like endonuclease